MKEPSTSRVATRRDPRHYQIAALLLLLLYGLLRLNFDVRLSQVVVSLATVLLTQYLCSRVWKLPVFDPRSAVISGLSLCLLLRTNSLVLAAAAAFATIASKFLLRGNGKHLFNPTNFGIVLMLLCAQGGVWVSPGQWGDFAFFAFLTGCLGGLVVNRAARADVTISFLVFYLAFVFGRSYWLGEPFAIPLHRLQNGALLVFAFFMISDPKTTPDSRAGRILFALFVALGAAFVQFKLFRTNGLLWSLAAFSLFVPFIDRLFPGQRYHWRQAVISTVSENESSTTKGSVYEPTPA
jgi:Na+-transporting NADH:ubiquinone oxidoreductase subunit NqrB